MRVWDIVWIAMALSVIVIIPCILITVSYEVPPQWQTIPMDEMPSPFYGLLKILILVVLLTTAALCTIYAIGFDERTTFDPPV